MRLSIAAISMRLQAASPRTAKTAEGIDDIDGGCATA